MDEQEANGTTLESGAPESDSPPSAVFHTGSIRTSTSSPRHTSRRAILKRVVIVPFRDVKGESGGGSSTITPSDSWAWRKYGQKPIRGSHYPRGYYRCSSSRSNGCLARKQVERSHEDPSLLIITYFREHNHPCPASRRNHNDHHYNSPDTTPSKLEVLEALPNPESEPEERFSDQSLIAADEFHWFGNMEMTSSTMMESPIFAERFSAGEDADTAMIFPMREEEESLFADLEELPECSVVFHRGRRGVVERNKQCPSPWCGTTS